MTYLVISDLHANIEALDAVVADAEPRGYEKIVCMGDLVGYGASPNEVVEKVRQLGVVSIRGNHDKVIAGVDTGEQFNPLAVKSCQWTRDALTKDNLEYLHGLPEGPLGVDGELWLAHGTPIDEDAYILNEFDAIEAFRGFSESICFFGHSHIPTIFSIDETESLFLLTPMSDEERVALKPGSRYLINCGSVGQPRDRNPKAAYGIFDSDNRILTVHRVAYPFDETQKKILATDLPGFLADRLAYGA